MSMLISDAEFQNLWEYHGQVMLLQCNFFRIAAIPKMTLNQEYPKVEKRANAGCMAKVCFVGKHTALLARNRHHNSIFF